MAQTMPLQHQKVNNIGWVASQVNSSNTTSSPRASTSTAPSAPHTLNITVDHHPPTTNTQISSAADNPSSSTFAVVHSPASAKNSLKKSSVNGSPAAPGKLGNPLDETNRSSFHSSGGLRSPDGEVKWTSFNDDSETEETPGSRHHSESEKRELINDDELLLSDGDESHESSFDPNEELTDDKSFEIPPELQAYYIDKFKKLLHASNYSTDDLRAPALKGSDPAVQDFFHRSQLTKQDLSKVWYLADVNMDGYLNLDEFMVAMHLIVRRVKGNYPIPAQLPEEFRPVATPPRNSTPVQQPSLHFDIANAKDSSTANRQWAEFANTPEYPKPPSPGGSSGGNTNSDPLSPTTLAQFTSIPPSDQQRPVACPKPRRGSPDYTRQPTSGGSKSPFGSISLTPFSANAAPVLPPLPRPRPSTSSDTKVKSPPPAVTATQISAAKILSPQTPNPPKGPPPKPPPRPPQRAHGHTRSVSLDLNKNRLAELTADAAVVPQSPSSTNLHPLPPVVDPQPRLMRDAHTQMSPVPQPTPLATSESASALPMLDLSIDMTNRTMNNSNTAAVTAANSTVTSSSTNQKAMTSSVTSGGSQSGGNQPMVDEDHSKDWKKRCARLARMNEDLEKELKKLTEVRLGLEQELKRMQKF